MRKIILILFILTAALWQNLSAMNAMDKNLIRLTWGLNIGGYYFMNRLDYQSPLLLKEPGISVAAALISYDTFYLFTTSIYNAELLLNWHIPLLKDTLSLTVSPGVESTLTSYKTMKDGGLTASPAIQTAIHWNLNPLEVSLALKARFFDDGLHLTAKPAVTCEFLEHYQAFLGSDIVYGSTYSGKAAWAWNLWVGAGVYF